MRIFQSFCARKSAISFDYFCRFCGVGQAFSVMKKKESRRRLNSPSPYYNYMYFSALRIMTKDWTMIQKSG